MIRTWRAVAALAVAGLIVLGASGCTSTEAASEPADHTAKVEQVEGSELNRIKLSDTAAQHVAIETSPVLEATTTAGKPAGKLVIPTSAVVYDPSGASWVYVEDASKWYTRSAITIDHISGAVSILTSGPPLGSAVVTAGTPELLGVEFGVGEE